MPKLVLSYRRHESAAMAGRIYDFLVTKYGAASVFIDLDNVPYGVDFKEHTRAILQQCDLIVVLVGPRWIGKRVDGSIGILNENDPVRIQVELAIQEKVTIFPVLVDGGQMPDRKDLPKALWNFPFINAAVVDSGRDFHPHVERLIRAIDDLVKMKAHRRSTLVGNLAERWNPFRKQTTRESTSGQERSNNETQRQTFSAEAKALQHRDDRSNADESKSLERAEEQNRREPEYWLRRVANERCLTPSDQPMVLVSFASEDQSWLNDLHAFLEPRLAELRDVDGRPYQLWNFSDAKRGTTPGDEFPEIVAEKMWRCRAAVIVLSRDYVRSQYCRHIELPFLMWRWEHHKLMCLPLKIGIVPIDKVRVPAFEGPARSVILDEIVDDRQAAADFAASTHRERNLKELKEAGLEAEIEKRLDGVSRRIAQFLKTRHGAREGM
jgi:hypothetical protein